MWNSLGNPRVSSPLASSPFQIWDSSLKAGLLFSRASGTISFRVIQPLLSWLVHLPVAKGLCPEDAFLYCRSILRWVSIDFALLLNDLISFLILSGIRAVRGLLWQLFPCAFGLTHFRQLLSRSRIHRCDRGRVMCGVFKFPPSVSSSSFHWY